MPEAIICPVCTSKGIIDHEGETWCCPACRGRGTIGNMSEHVITIKEDQAAIDKSWDDLLHLGLTTGLYHLLESKGIISKDEIAAIANKQIERFEKDFTGERFADNAEEGQRHLDRLKGYIAKFLSDKES